MKHTLFSPLPLSPFIRLLTHHRFSLSHSHASFFKLLLSLSFLLLSILFFTPALFPLPLSPSRALSLSVSFFLFLSLSFFHFPFLSIVYILLTPHFYLYSLFKFDLVGAI